MKVKICGVTNLDDALAAAEAGADMLGFNFYPDSPRYITPAACCAITGRLAARGLTALAVGVFVNAPPAAVEVIAEECGLDLLQIHGDEPPAWLERLGPRAFKAIRPATARDADDALARYRARPTAPALLVDAHRPGRYGGTGEIAGWDVAATLAGRYPILLAGGLTPENVAEAIRQVRPWGVDTASGVERAPGEKDHARVAAFVAAARAGDPEKEETC